MSALDDARALLALKPPIHCSNPEWRALVEQLVAEAVQPERSAWPGALVWIVAIVSFGVIMSKAADVGIERVKVQAAECGR